MPNWLTRLDPWAHGCDAGCRRFPPCMQGPELTGAFERLWADTCGILRKRGIAAPDRLTSDIPDLMAFWQRPDLVLSQTCGYPFPSFSEGSCCPCRHTRLCIARLRARLLLQLHHCPRRHAARAARGFRLPDLRVQRDPIRSRASPRLWSRPRPGGFTFANRVATGAHVASARMVAQGQADIAAIDAVSWRHIDRFETWTDRLRVLEHTPPTPGLPFITANHVHAEEIANCLDVAIAKIPATDRGMLGLRSLVRIPREAYLAVADPGTDARSSTPPLSPQPE